MEWNDEQFLADLQNRVDAFDQAGAAHLSARLIARLDTGEPIGDKVGRQTLGTLRRKRHFGLMERVAEALRAAGLDDEQVRRQYAQALIDQGKPSAAAYILELLVKTSTDPREQVEAHGLLGRLYKQLYVNAVNSDPGAATRPAQLRNLHQALSSYWGVYRDQREQLWHGINAVALLARAKRDGVPAPCDADAAQVARQILDTVVASEKAHVTAAAKALAAGEPPPAPIGCWDLATAAEASLALGDFDAALGFIGRYVARPDADAFELSSTERQLREVWGLTVEQPPGSILLPILQANILNRRGGRIELPSGTVAAAIGGAESALARPSLQKILGPHGVVSVTWYREGLERAAGVAQIREHLGGAIGTGFLIRGGDLVAAFGDELMILTNSHVVSDDSEVQRRENAVAAKDARVVFDELAVAKGKEYRVTQVWTSSPPEPDATLLRLSEAIVGFTPPEIAANMPALGVQTPGRKQVPPRVFVIGHPKGGVLSFSLQDNDLLDYDGRLVHYRAPTEDGSSGSPVFDDRWRLVALHHAGSKETPRLNDNPGTYEANEGIQFSRILEKVRSSWS